MSSNPANRSAVNQKHTSWQINQNDGPLTELNKQIFDQMSDIKGSVVKKRPKSAYSRGSSNSRMTNVPDVSRVKLLMIATDIFKNRQAITDFQRVLQGNLRDTLSSSEIQSLLKKIGLPLEIGVVKALLKDLGFNWNGKSCSMMSLFTKCQEFAINQDTQQSQRINTAPSFIEVGPSKPQVDELIQKLKDLFYTSKKSIYELFQESKTGQSVDISGLSKLVQKYSSNTISAGQLEIIFKAVSKGADSLSYQQFEQAFTWQKLTGTEWETKCIRAIKDWMNKNSLSADSAFNLLLTVTGKAGQKKLTRVDFHAALADLDFKFSAPEVDGLFKAMDANSDGELDREEWSARIYCDSQNPL